jgi:hypothetical protein
VYQQTKEDIDLLLNVARDEIINAEGNHHLFNDVSLKYGHIAHRVYLALDTPNRPSDLYHDKEARRVLLDPWTVIMRSRAFQDNGPAAVDDPNFWNHSDMIKTLIDYLALTYSKEFAYVPCT